jgi:hypothetical protein
MAGSAAGTPVEPHSDPEGGSTQPASVEDPETTRQAPTGMGRTGIILLVAIILLFVTGILVILVAGRDNAERASMLALVLCALVAGGLTGALVVSPGAASGESGTASANEEGWVRRLGIFGSWITGAAFVLLIAKAAAVETWFVHLTGSVAGIDSGPVTQRAVLVQYALGGLLIAAAAGGFIFGFVLMATDGRIVFAKAAASDRMMARINKVESRAGRAEESAEKAVEVSKEALSAVDDLKAAQRED